MKTQKKVPKINTHEHTQMFSICFISSGDGEQEILFLKYFMNQNQMVANQISMTLIDIMYSDTDCYNEVLQRITLAGFHKVVLYDNISQLIHPFIDIDLFCSIGFQIAFSGDLEAINNQKQEMRDTLAILIPRYNYVSMWLYHYSIRGVLPGWENPQERTFGSVMARYIA